MMRNNGLLKWTLHKNNKNGTGGKNWIHPPEALSTGHIAYLVKFLGVVEAEAPKGMEIVKESIRKLKLDEDIRRAEGGKTPKAEVTISMDGVAIQEPKGKKILHQFPLHQISYCADDKEEKRFFSFIAKEGDVHKCFVFASEKLAEEITLTIGQAFDLAYKRYLDSSGRELDLKKEIMMLQKRVAELETENSNLKEKLSLHSVDGQSNSSLSSGTSNGNGGGVDLLICPPVPPRGSANAANQIFAEFAMTANEIEKRAQNGHGKHVDLFDDEFDSKPRGNPDGVEAPPRISPPPKGKKAEPSSGNTLTTNGFGGSNSGSSFGGSSTDVFGSDPFFTSDPSSAPPAVPPPAGADVFGMSTFGSNSLEHMSNGGGLSHNNNNNHHHQQTHANIMNGYNNLSSTNNKLNNNTMNFNNGSLLAPATTAANYNNTNAYDFSNLFVTSPASTMTNNNNSSVNSTTTTNNLLDNNKRLDFANNTSNNSSKTVNNKQIDLSSLDMLDPFRM